MRSDLTLIYADSRKRDSTVAILIKEFLRRKNQPSFIASRRNLSVILRLITPANVILIGQINILYDQVYNGKVLKKEFIGMNIYFYPSEGYAMEHEYRQMYPDCYNYDGMTRIFLWGQESLSWVAENVAIKQEALDNTGYPRLKLGRIYAKLQSAKHRKIGFVGRFPLLNDLYGVLSMKYLVGEFANGKPYQASQVERLEAEGRTVPIMLRTIKFIMEQTDYFVSFRPHPNEDRRSYDVLKQYFGERFEISEEVDAAEWIAGCNKIVGLASSSYIDASLVNVPVICLDKISNVVEQTMKYEPALKLIYEVAYLPETFEELTSLIEKDIEIKKSVIFDELMRTNFVGNYEDPIRHVADSIQFKKRKVSTWAVTAALGLMDILLLARIWIRRRTALDFDYSAFLHGENKSFVNKYIDDK
jgi:surface carbohydrate biosynthesis protein